MREPTAEEQLLVELINRARLDPLAEAARYGIDLNEGLADGTISDAPKDPLAVSLLLGQAAYDHSLWMLEADVFSHTGAGGSSVGDRATAAGYAWNWVGENLSWTGTTGDLGDLGLRIEQQHANLFLSEGHRANMLRAEYVEIGAAQAVGRFTMGGTTYNASMVTQVFGRPTSGARFFTGVVSDDRDGDDFYDIGEGLGGVTVTAAGAAGTFTTTSFAAGGYSLAVPDGSYTLTFSGGALEGTVSVSAVMAGHNVKIDAEQDDAALVALAPVPASTTGHDAITGTDAADEIDGRGGDDLIDGAGGDDILRGAAGWDSIWGGAGNDGISGGFGNDRLWGGGDDDLIGGGAQHDTLWGGSGNDTLRGGAGDDVLDGETGHDRLLGGWGNDRLLGGAGDDVLAGGFGDDVLEGGDGNDRLDGNGGGDVLAGGAGDDELWGGLGADRFVFVSANGTDRVHDFVAGLDRLDFRAVAGVAGPADLAIAQAGDDTVIDLPDGGRVVLLGVSADAFGLADLLV